MSEIVDEETALLSAPNAKQKQKPTPLPVFQLLILMFVQTVEPICSHCIYPFINQLVSELDITHGNPKAVGYYAGLIQALFFAAEACTVMHWSRLSDRIGRKPVLLTGLAGLTVSMVGFGLSRTFWTLVLTRCLAGMLNGNIGVIKSMMGDLTDETNIARGFALMPIPWCFGVTIGPSLGGALARPADNFPKLFSAPFWKKWPYFLPCATAAAITLAAYIVGLLFLKESAPVRTIKSKKPPVQDACSQFPVPSSDGAGNEEPVPFRRLLVYPVLISVINYIDLAVLDIAFSALQTLMYATPIEYGGLGLPPARIGLCLSAFGFATGVFQLLFFARIVEAVGRKRLFIIGMCAFVPLFLLFPVMSLVAKRCGLTPYVWILIAVQITIQVIMDLCYGCVFIFINSSSPNKRSLGATNGLAQMGVSIARAVGPAASTTLFALSVEHRLLDGNLVYVVMVVVAFASLWFAQKLPRDSWKTHEGSHNVSHDSN